MAINTICVSSGHGAKISGANGFLIEVQEARRVVEKVAEYLRQSGVTAYTFHDDTSRNVSQNIGTIVRFHNSKQCELDVSIHFNAGNSGAGGTEVLYLSDNNQPLAAKVSAAIANALGIPNRGAKKRIDLGFLKGTNANAILIEVCFVDSKSNADAYNAKFNEVCKAIAESLSGKQIAISQPTQPVKLEGIGRLKLIDNTVVRKEATSESTIVGTVYVNEEYSVWGINGEWYNVGSGYVHSSLAKYTPHPNVAQPNQKKEEKPKGIGVVEVTIDTVLRQDSVYTSKIIRNIPKGDKYVVYELKDGWFNAGSGWLAKDCVKYTMNDSNVKVIK